MTEQSKLFPDMEATESQSKPKRSRKKKRGYEPPNLGKAIHLDVPNFDDPDRPPVCLEVDFPILPINELSYLEGNAGKPIYQMSKWWARRRSSVFRSMLIAAALKAPKKPEEAAKLVWEHYYANHQKAKHFEGLRVLDPFMGGGTTLVEGARLGFQVTGVDLNPVAWFVTKNEVAGTDPEPVKAFFDEIETEVKPLVQPFYTTTCPRGHKGHWIDVETGQVADVEPLDLPPEERKRYRWEGPEVIYTFWVKHGPCQAPGCGHRTPIFKNPVIAEKTLTTNYIPLKCAECGESFRAELGETRIAPGAEYIVLPDEPRFTVLSQSFSALLSAYNMGRADDKRARIEALYEQVEDETGLRCPRCSAFAGDKVKETLEKHAEASRVSDINKRHFGIKRYKIHSLLVHPEWMEGDPGYDQDGQELGGYAGAPVEATAEWYRHRLKGLRLLEVRGRKLPKEIVLENGSKIQTCEGTMPRQAHFICRSCGRQQNILESVKATGHTAPVAVYALQCYCPDCASEGYNYNGRYFKLPDEYDIERLIGTEREWADRSKTDLRAYWPREELLPAYMTYRLNGGIPNWGYTHWWKMFNPRQLLVHANLLRAISDLGAKYSLKIREQVLGAFQQYLRNQNMFCFWDFSRDCLAPHMSNANYHPKQQVVENNVFAGIGRGNWESDVSAVLEGVEWASDPWEAVINPHKGPKSLRLSLGDPVKPDVVSTMNRSSTDLAILGTENSFDLVITDPPFGDNLFYADLADFFYVWLRIPLLRWYEGKPEQAYFESQQTPHALEAIRNTLEHPDDRQDWETHTRIPQKHLKVIRHLSGEQTLQADDPNPLYRPEPASDFYQQTLTACWAEGARLLKPGGLMAFTFHHSEDTPWIDVLEALFNAGYILVATYPIRSDETKGEGGAFGSRKIEYDIIHVCRKRLKTPEPVSWAKMRRWVKDEVLRLQSLLELSHGQELPESDLRVILRGKALEFYSRHYRQVYTGDESILSVRDALLGINQILDDLLQGVGEEIKLRPPNDAEPLSRLFLSIVQGKSEMDRDELHKMLRGTGFSPDDLEAMGWIQAVRTTVYVIPVAKRFEFFTAPGRTRKILKTDLDQAHFLAGAAMPHSGVDITRELDNETFQPKHSVDAILEWYTQTDIDPSVRQAAGTAHKLVTHWRSRPHKSTKPVQFSFLERLDEEE